MEGWSPSGGAAPGVTEGIVDLTSCITGAQAAQPSDEEPALPYRQATTHSGSSFSAQTRTPYVEQATVSPMARMEIGVQDNQMRNVIFAINITVNGCCDHTKVIGDDETLEYFTNLLRDVDLQVFGRKTYQLMVPYWPEVAKSQSETKASKEFARAFDSGKKIVFSRSLSSAEDDNTRIVRSDLRDEILKLKQEQGKHILVGGVSVPSQLIELGLVDEYRFVVSPIVAGEGTRLLEGVSLPQKLKLQLKLIDSKIFGSGCVVLRYLKQ